MWQKRGLRGVHRKRVVEAYRSIGFLLYVRRVCENCDCACWDRNRRGVDTQPFRVFFSSEYRGDTAGGGQKQIGEGVRTTGWLRGDLGIVLCAALWWFNRILLPFEVCD